METNKVAQISWFPVPAEDEVHESLRGLFRKAKEPLGFVPNVFRVYSYRPERLIAWFGHYKQLHEPTAHLNAAERVCFAATAATEPVP